jgi:hypothetical protein
VEWFKEGEIAKESCEVSVITGLRRILEFLVREDISVAAWSERLLSELDAADRRARELLNGLSEEQLNWQPAAEVWSVGQCLDHLCVTNEIYLPPISSALVGKPKMPVSEISPGWFGRWFLQNFVEPSTSMKRVGAPKKIVPGARIGISVLGRFLFSNQAARKLIGHAGEHDVNRIRFRNPLLPVIWFTVGTGLEIVIGHEKRHLLQAERVKASMGFPRE